MGEWLTSQILHESQTQEPAAECAVVLDRLDKQVLDFATRLMDVEDQIYAGALSEGLKNLYDGLKLLNSELLQTSGETAMQTSALAVRIDAVAFQLDENRAESVKKRCAADRHLNEIAELLCKRDAALKEDIVRVDTYILAKADEFDLRFKHLSEDVLGRYASLAALMDGINSDAKEAELLGAEKSKAAQDRHGLISERIDLQESVFEKKLNDRDASYDVFRGEASKKIDAIQQFVQALTTETARNSAAIFDCSDLAQSLKYAQGQTADRAGALELTIGELDSKLETAVSQAATTTSELSAMRAELVEISALQAEDGVHIGGELKELRDNVSSQRSEAADKLTEVERSLTDLSDQLVAANASLAEKLETVDDKLTQLYANAADTSSVVQARLASSEQGLTDLDNKFSIATDKISKTSGVLWQLLTQVAGQSATELRSLKSKVQKVEEAEDQYHREVMPGVIAMKDRVFVVCQSISNIETRQSELSNLLMLSHERDVAMASAISMLEQKLKQLEARTQSLEPTDASRLVMPTTNQKLLDQPESAQHDAAQSDTSGMKTINERESSKSEHADLPIQGNDEHTSAIKGQDERFYAVGFDEWDAEYDEPIAAAPSTAESAANAVPGSAEISDAAASQNGRADLLSGEHRDGEFDGSDTTGALSAQILPLVEHSVLQPMQGEVQTDNNSERDASFDSGHASTDVPPIIDPQAVLIDALTSSSGKFFDVPLNPISPEANEATTVAEGSVSFLAAARLAAKNAAEYSDSKESEMGAFRKYFGGSSSNKTRAQRLRKSAIQLVGVAAIFAVCVAAAKYFAVNQSILPRALASIDGVGHGAELRRAGLVQRNGSSAKDSGLGYPIVASIDTNAVQLAGRAARISDLDESATAIARENSHSRNDGKYGRGLASESGNASNPAYLGGRWDEISALATAGDANAQLAVGLLYLSRGNDATNSLEAVKWLKLAANGGKAIAQYRLGALYAAGRGVPADQARAVHWYETAANLGNRKAMYNLALAYVQGKGVAKNPSEMMRWFLKAANFGLVDAQFDLAVLYERGAGVPQSLLHAYRWYAIAAHNGDKESQRRVQILATQLSGNVQEAAQKSADEFNATPMNPDANVVSNPSDMVRARP